MAAMIWGAWRPKFRLQIQAPCADSRAKSCNNQAPSLIVRPQSLGNAAFCLNDEALSRTDEAQSLINEARSFISQALSLIVEARSLVNEAQSFIVEAQSDFAQHLITH